MSAQELPVHWDGIEDKESGVKSLEVSIGCLIDKLYVRLSLDARVVDCLNIYPVVVCLLVCLFVLRQFLFSRCWLFEVV